MSKYIAALEEITSELLELAAICQAIVQLENEANEKGHSKE